MEQIFIQNSSLNHYSNSAFSPISARTTNRQSFAAIDNLLSIDCSTLTIIISFLYLFHFLGNTKSMVHSQQSQQPSHMVQSGGRNNSMPTWRGYLPIKFESMATDQYQLMPHFSQKVFLGGIPSELTEGTVIHYFI